MPDPTPPRAVFARHAASLLVFRPGRDGPEVLMGVRGAGARFVPNRLVFPGGAVDPADARAPAAAEPRADVLDRLGRRPRLARAIVMAAARELHEETGASLGTPPRLDTVDYLCRAVTPPRQPIRFNARFLVVSADHLVGNPTPTEELRDTRFITVPDALTLDLMLVTQGVLRRFQAWFAMSEPERRARTDLPLFKEKDWRSITIPR